jgi:hypothetical protein
MTTKRQSPFPARLSLDSRTETASVLDWDHQALEIPHFNLFTDFLGRLSVSTPSSSTLLSVPRRFTTITLQTYHSTTARFPAFRALTAKITRRRRTAVIFVASIGVLVLLAIVTGTAPASLIIPKPRTWEYERPIGVHAAFASVPVPLHERRNPHDLVLNPEQELGVLVSFLTAVKANMLPSDIDPSKPLDPQLVVDFDTREEGAEKEVEALVAETWSNYPVVIFSQVS